jgi:16S rRNA (cytosine1402-N4)-methyltransferase
MSGGHVPVMLNEAVAALSLRDGGVYLDGTFGAGGYTRAMLDGANCTVIGLDRDPAAALRAQALSDVYAERFRYCASNFSAMDDAAAGLGFPKVDGVVLDIGVSSFQFDEADRGFSFMRDGPLDMRMAADGPSAADAVNQLSRDDLADIFHYYGEERAARRIAAAIVMDRDATPFTRTIQLASLIERLAGKAGKDKIHPATRVFQALRIFVNDELGELAMALEAAERLLVPNGRLVVVSFHSLEDRIVKQFFAERSGEQPGGSRHLPAGASGPAATFSLALRKAQTASDAEIAINPRSRSAKLRAGIRTGASARLGADGQRFGAPSLDVLRRAA